MTGLYDYRLEIRDAARDAGYGDDVPDFVRDEANALHDEMQAQRRQADLLSDDDYEQAIVEFPRDRDSQIAYVSDIVDDLLYDVPVHRCHHPSLSAYERNR